MTYTLKPCPHCGHQPEEGNLYDSVHMLNREGTLWTAGCVDNEGGCNASVLAGSREEAIERWNKRVSVSDDDADAWLFISKRPGTVSVHASIDPNDCLPLDAWKTVERVPLIKAGERVTLWPRQGEAESGRDQSLPDNHQIDTTAREDLT